MSTLRGRKITLEIVYDTEESSDPINWQWFHLLDLAHNEQVTITDAAEFSISSELAAELENNKLNY